MLGGGNPVGSNPAGTGKGVNYIRTGERTFAFANSGEIGASQTAQTALELDTGNETIVGQIDFNPQCEISNLQSGTYAGTVSINDEVIAIKLLEGTDFYNPNLNIIIPAYSRVKIEVKSGENTDGEKITVLLTGRVY